MWKYIVTAYNKEFDGVLVAVTAWSHKSASDKARDMHPKTTTTFTYRLPYWAIIRYAIDKHFYYRPKRTISRSHGGDS